jgi:hypothetical protein
MHSSLSVLPPFPSSLLLVVQSLLRYGKATFYGGNFHGGAFSFSTYTLPAGIFGTALSDSQWNNSANCGACVLVTGPDENSITAMVGLIAALSPIEAGDLPLQDRR